MTRQAFFLKLFDVKRHYESKGDDGMLGQMFG